MLKTTEFIKINGLEALTAKFAIQAKRGLKHPNLVQLKYNQIESPMSEPIVQECRGLILDESNDWAIICFPYKKFFNHGEGHAAKIDMSTVKVMEKADGSLMTLYNYRDEWQVASSGIPDASGPIETAKSLGINTFAELFWKTWNDLGYRLPQDKNICYMFEMMTPFNRIIVQHTKSRIVLHGARNLTTLQELQPEPLASVNGWECIKSFPLTTMEEILAYCKQINPIKEEGFVLCDANFSRVKVKSPQYVALSSLCEGMGTKRLLTIIQTNENSEFLTYFPEWGTEFRTLNKKYQDYATEIERVYLSIKDTPAQKDFAMLALKHKFSGILFGLRAKKIQSVLVGLSQMPVKTLMDHLGIGE